MLFVSCVFHYSCSIKVYATFWQKQNAAKTNMLSPQRMMAG